MQRIRIVDAPQVASADDPEYPKPLVQLVLGALIAAAAAVDDVAAPSTVDAIVAVLSDHELAVRLGDGALRSSTQWNRTPTEYARKVRDLVETVLARS